MKKRFVVSAIGAGIAGFVIGKKSAQNQGSHLNQDGLDRTLLNAGKPDQVADLELDQIENAKMVSEGSQFGVQYYNNIKAEE